MANNSYRLEDEPCSAAEVRRAVAIARGVASASGRRCNREAEIAEQQVRRRARRRQREDDALTRFEDACRRRMAAALRRDARDRRAQDAAIHVRRQGCERRLPGFDRHRPLPLPRGSMASGWATPTADADGRSNLVLRLWTHGASGGKRPMRDAMARKARYVIDPAALAGPAEEVVLTNMLPRAPDAPGAHALEEEVVACCRAIEEMEMALAKRDRDGHPRVQLFKHAMVALPAGLSHRGRVAVAHAILDRLEKAGLPFVAAIHHPSRQRGEQDPRNFHLQILVSTRPFRVTGPRAWAFAPLKDQETLGPEGLRLWRREIVAVFNAALIAERIPARYTARTRAERGLFGRPQSPVPQVPVHAQLEALADRFEVLAEASDRLSGLRTRTEAARVRHKLQARLMPVMDARTRVEDMHVRASLRWHQMCAADRVAESSTGLQRVSGRLAAAVATKLQADRQALAALGNRMESGLIHAFHRHRARLASLDGARRRLLGLSVPKRLTAVEVKARIERARRAAQPGLQRLQAARSLGRRLDTLRAVERLGQSASRRRDAAMAALQAAHARLATLDGGRERVLGLNVSGCLEEARKKREAALEQAAKAKAAAAAIAAQLAATRAAWERLHGLEVLARLKEIGRRLDREESRVQQQYREAEAARRLDVAEVQLPRDDRPFPREPERAASRPHAEDIPREGEGKTSSTMNPAQLAAWLARHQGQGR